MPLPFRADFIVINALNLTSRLGGSNGQAWPEDYNDYSTHIEEADS